MPPDRLSQQLLAFSDGDGRQFELDVGAFLNRHVEWTAWQKVEPDLVALLGADPPGDAVPAEEANRIERLRFAALYILAMRQRRLHQVDQYRDHMAIFESKTKDSPSEQARRYRGGASYDHLTALLRAMESGPRKLGEAIELATRAYEKCGGRECRHSGIVHHLASLKAASAERKPTSEGTAAPDLGEALDLAERAIELEDKPYAKYYATRGRIRALLGEYDAAEGDVQRAICNEGDSWDYPLRYADYRAVLAQIEMRRLRADLQRAQALLDKAQAEFEESRTSQVELLGFFAGVLALVLAGVQMAQGGAEGPHGAEAGAAMLILLTGCLLAAFGALGVLLHGRRFWQRPMAVCVVGLALIVGAVMFVLPASG